MDWLIGIGRSKLGTSSSSSTRTIRSNEENQKPYMNDTDNLKNLVNKVTKDNIQESVPAPMGVDINEWLATNTLSFYSHISLLYDSLNEFCSPNTCTTVSTGTPMNYTWVDDRGKKVRLSAPQYIELVIVQIEKYVTDETVFPTKYDMIFPTNFLSVVKRIFRMLFHILVHMFQSHYEHLTDLQLLSVLNTVFIHFMYFQTEHNLLESKEVHPLEDLIKSLCL